MAALQIIAVMFLTINFLTGGFGVTDEEFKVGTLVFIRSEQKLNHTCQNETFNSVICCLLQDLEPLVANVIREMKEAIYVSQLSFKTNDLFALWEIGNIFCSK